MSSFGEVIITGRVAAGMTQEDLANAIGVTQAAMSRYENDLREPDADTIELEVASVYPTTKWADVGITEVQFFAG